MNAIASSRTALGPAVDDAGGGSRKRFSACENPSHWRPRFITCRLLHLAIFNEIFLTSSAVLWRVCVNSGSNSFASPTPRRCFVSCPSYKTLVCLSALLLLGVQLLRAEVTAGVLGTVVDPSGAAVSGATVVLRNPDTGLQRRAKTNESGEYEFLAVPVGEKYSVQAEAKGFEKSVQSGIKLVLNQKYRADFKLVVGAVTETVEVTGATAQVDTTNTQLGDVIENKKMTSLPLNGRSYIDLLGLQAGVVPISSEGAIADRKVSGNGDSGQVSVNGQRESANSFLVNGGDVEESVDNGASIVPTLDSIQEFRLLTNSFNAEYGRFSGAIVNVLTKSGTNEIHGSAYEFLRNEKLDARNYFDLERGRLSVTSSEALLALRLSRISSSFLATIKEPEKCAESPQG